MSTATDKISLPQLVLRQFLRGRPKPLVLPQPRDHQRGKIPWLAVIIVLALALRSYHYFINPPVWHDEAAQIYNVFHKDFGEILGPLYYSEACPPLFLAAEKIIYQLLGDSVFSLRLLPFLASCAAYLLLVHLGRRVLPPAGVRWFALLLGCSDRLLAHACEAKPYSVDVLVAAVVLAIGLRFREAFARPNGHWRWLVLSTAASPFLMFLSFPACFLLGGLTLSVFLPVRRLRRPSARLLYTAMCAVIVCSFLALYTTAIQAQKNDRMVACWEDKFPPWHEPWLVPAMLGIRLTELFRYAAEPAGNVLVVLGVIGGIWLWRQGQQLLLGVLLWPIALNAVAWLLSSYPLEASRVVVYAAPAALLLIAAGLPPALEWLGRWGRAPRLALVVVAMVPIGLTAWVLVKPWGRLDSEAPTTFVLDRRLPNEPVIGTLWEQAYYCRRLGQQYRSLAVHPTEPPSLRPAADADGAAVESLWLLASPDPAEQLAQIVLVRPNSDWHVVERHEFRDVVVLRIARQSP